MNIARVNNDYLNKLFVKQTNSNNDNNNNIVHISFLYLTIYIVLCVFYFALNKEFS